MKTPRSPSTRSSHCPPATASSAQQVRRPPLSPPTNSNPPLTLPPGMCLGGHLAYRCALDPRVRAAQCYFATDLHAHSLGHGTNDDSLARASDLRHAELVLIFGKQDNHVPPAGRDLIRKTLHEAGVRFSFYEHAWAQRMSMIFSFHLSLSVFLERADHTCTRRVYPR